MRAFAVEFGTTMRACYRSALSTRAAGKVRENAIVFKLGRSPETVRLFKLGRRLTMR